MGVAMVSQIVQNYINVITNYTKSKALLFFNCFAAITSC